MTLVTTHHSRLKAYAAETPEAVNAAMEFDEVTLEPTYRLLAGLPGKSSGIDIAQRLGLDPVIVAKARTLIDPSEAQAAALVAKLHEQKAEIEREMARVAREQRELEERKQRLEQEFERERRAKLKELDKRLEETLRQHEEKWERTIAEIRAQIEAQSQSSKAARGLERKAVRLEREAREEWDAQVLETLGEPESADSGAQDRVKAAPAVGDRVRVQDLSTPGTVSSLLDDDHLQVEVGRLRMRVRKDEVRVLGSASVPPAFSKSRVSGKVEVSGDTVDAPAEINVIGSTAEEACEQVDKFLDQAYLAGRARLRIIHGHGKGILRTSLHEMFTSHPHVEKFYSAPPNEGGAGATIVELKV